MVADPAFRCRHCERALRILDAGSVPMEFGPLVVRLLPVLSALVVASIVAALVPLRQQSRRANGRLATNPWLLAVTLALGILLNFILALGAAYFAQRGIGALLVLGITALPPSSSHSSLSTALHTWSIA